MKRKIIFLCMLLTGGAIINATSSYKYKNKECLSNTVDSGVSCLNQNKVYRPIFLDMAVECVNCNRIYNIPSTADRDYLCPSGQGHKIFKQRLKCKNCPHYYEYDADYDDPNMICEACEKPFFEAVSDIYTWLECKVNYGITVDRTFCGYMPLRGNKIVVKNNYKIIKNAILDDSGKVSFQFENSKLIGNNITLEIYAGDDNVDVKAPAGSSYYEYKDIALNIGKVNVADIDILGDMSTGVHKAFYIGQGAMRARDFAKAVMTSSKMGSRAKEPADVKIIYPTDNKSDYANKRICIPEDFSYIIDLTMAMYGHYIQHELNCSKDIDYMTYHGTEFSLFKENLIDQKTGRWYYFLFQSWSWDETLDDDEGKQLAWHIGWSAAFATIAQQYCTNIGKGISLNVGEHFFGDSIFWSNYDLDSYNLYESVGDDVPYNIAGVLWDIFDGVSGGLDAISLDYESWFAITTTIRLRDFDDFRSTFCNKYGNMKNQFKVIANCWRIDW